MLADGIIEAVRTRRVLAVGLFVTGTAVALAFEWLLLGPQPLPGPMTLSAGVLAGAVLVARPARWPLLVAIALVLRTAFVIRVGGVGPALPLLIETVGVVAVATLLGAAPLLMRDGRPGEVAPNELVGASIGIAIAGASVLGVLRYLISTSATPAADATTAALSLLLGIATTTAPIVVFGRRTHAARPLTTRRILQITVSALLFVMALHVALGHKPESAWRLLGDYAPGWTWIAVALGIIMTLRLHSIGSNLIVALAVTGAALVFFRDHDVAVNEQLSWQISALGTLVVLISCNALIGGVRRANDQRRAQQEVSHIMLARAEPSGDEVGDQGDEFQRALEVAAEYSGADTARLYWLDSDTRKFGVAHAWPAGESTAYVSELRPLRETLAPVILGRTAQLSASPDDDPRVAEALRILDLADMKAAHLQPIVSGGRVIGIAALGSRQDIPFRSIDVAPLMTMISEFYVSTRTRARALASIGNYQRRLRELAARTALAEERVRRETAVELHDGLIQRLAVARMKLGELRHRAGNSGPVGAITDIVDESLATSRAIIHDLSPSVVYELGLIPGLEKLVDDLRTEGRFHLTLRQHGDGCPLEEAVRVGVYHVVQELVANSLAHSGGDRIWIDVYWEQTALDAVVVSDNGRGDAWWLAETRADEPSGLGLLSASERLRPIGYDIKFERRHGGGTRAIVYWSSPAEG